jgi:hypothetical protein
VIRAAVATIRAMLTLRVLRRAAARAALAALAREITFDQTPSGRRRSRVQHLRNGIGTMLLTSSRFAWRPSLAFSVHYLTTGGGRAELRYGLGELAQAVPPRSRVMERWAVAIPLVLVPTAAAVIAVRVRGRRRVEQPL